MFNFKTINWAGVLIGVVLTVVVIAVMVNGKTVETDSKDGKMKVRLFGSKSDKE